MLYRYLKAFLEPTWRLPISFVPSSQLQYLESLRQRKLHWVLKYVKRRIFLEFFVRRFGLVRECHQIHESHERILWINFAAPSLGDSLMDLAARSLLRGREIILLTSAKNAPLFEVDDYFCAVYTSWFKLKKMCKDKPFDLVICDAFSPRVLIRKILVAPTTDFLGFYGFLNGFEVHRTYYSFARMRELLSLDNFDHPVRPTLRLPACRDNLPHIDVCIAVGGEWSFRTYDHWPEIIQELVERNLSVSLIGSANGIAQAKKITKLHPIVRSTVGQLSLSEVILEIANAKVFLGADGGLWHIATAIPRPTLVLFADCQLFDVTGARVTRETSDMVCEILYDDREVSNIAVREVFSAFKRLWYKLGLSL